MADARLVVVGATDEALLAGCPPHIGAVARFAPVAQDPYVAVTEVLWRTLAGLCPDPGAPPLLPPQVHDVPVLLAADDYLVDVSTVFVRRCDQTERRLKPSDSIRLETSELLRRFAAGSGWHGPAQVLVSRHRATAHAAALGAALSRSLDTPVVVCEVHGTSEPEPGTTARHPCGPYLIVARVLENEATGDPARSGLLAVAS